MNGRRARWERSSACLLVVSALAVAGCGSGEEAQGADVKKPQAEKQTAAEVKLEPVTISIYNNAGSGLETLESYIKQPVEKKYPHITVKVLMPATGATLKDLVATNSAPDLVYGLLVDEQWKLKIDLAPLMAKFKFDKNAIKPRLWEYNNYYTGTTITQDIPFLTNQHVLYYNKNLFDRFGVAYPKDGMTWDETYEIAKKMTRTDNGIKYRGFNFRHSLNFEQAQIPMPYVEGEKAAINSEIWKRYFTNFARFFEIPGNELTKGVLSTDTLFYKDKIVAMYAAHPFLGTLVNEAKAGNDLDWDMVSLPTFPEFPKQGTAPNTVGIGITNATKHQDDAFRVLEVASSEEVQTLRSQLNYSESVRVDDQKAREVFGKGSPVEHKHLAALYYNNYAPARKPSPYTGDLKPIAVTYFEKVVIEGMDINSALRQAEEDMNKKIAEVKATR